MMKKTTVIATITSLCAAASFLILCGCDQCCGRRQDDALIQQNADNSQSGFIITDIDEAKKKSADTGKPILMIFSGSDWCSWCKRLDEEIFAQEPFQDWAQENVILFQADFPRQQKLPEKTMRQNEELSHDYNVIGFPTVIITDSKGKELGRTGYLQGGVNKYIQHLESLFEKKEGNK